MRKHIIWIIVLAVSILGLILFFSWMLSSLPTPTPAPNTSVPPNSLDGQPTLPMETITVGGVPLLVEVASTDAQREAGLSGRTSLESGKGMLFVFSEPGDYGFWMKEMLFPLDIIWADSSGTIVTIYPNLSPSTYPKSFSSILPSQYVLELPANFAATHGITVGSKIVL